MRLGLILVFAALGLGCQSKAKAPEAPASATPAQAVEKAVAAKVEAAKTATTPAAAPATGGAKVECGNKADKRIIEVRAKDKGCELAYTKNGQEAVIATSINGSAHCTAKSEALVEKLKAAGFTCN